jgi:kynurenine--oxoglutarate transaminase/cysteine-S-conjugate beta-lyase/glutamine--phenylpyruvate transaminase
VIIFEPAFDLYPAHAEMAQARIVSVPLRVIEHEGVKRWSLDIEEFARAFSPRTRMVVLNTPHNPTGKVFTREELREMADVIKAQPNTVLVVSDEVYENLVFTGHVHYSMASFPDMYDQCLTISSAGKTFSVTGWKMGWVVAPPHLLRCVAIASQWICFSCCNPLQVALAAILDEADKPFEGHANFYDWLRVSYEQKRDALASSLVAAGIEAIMPEGAFFIIGETSKLQVPQAYTDDLTVCKDWALCRWLTKDIGVAAIPPSAFYCKENQHMAANLARFAFCKPDEVLQEAGKRLLRLAAR